MVPINVRKNLPQITRVQDQTSETKNNKGVTVLIPVDPAYAKTTNAQVAHYTGWSTSYVKRKKKSGEIPSHFVSAHRSIFFNDEIEKAAKENPHLAPISHPPISTKKSKPREKSHLKITCILRPNGMIIRVWYEYCLFYIPCSADIFGDNVAVMSLVEDVIRFREEQKNSKGELI